MANTGATQKTISSVTISDLAASLAEEHQMASADVCRRGWHG